MNTTRPDALALGHNSISDRLAELARAYDNEAVHTDSVDQADSIERASATLRLVRTMHREGVYDDLLAYAWLHAGTSLLDTLRSCRLHGVAFTFGADL